MVFFTKPFPAHDLLHYLMSHFLHCYKNITNYIFILSLLFVLVYIFVTFDEFYTCISSFF